MTKKMFVMVVLSAFAFAMVACDKDKDEGESFNNVEACENLEDTLNGLECWTGADYDGSCEGYDGLACDLSDYFDCVADSYGCDGDALTFDNAKYTDECVPQASCD